MASKRKRACLNLFVCFLFPFRSDNEHLQHIFSQYQTIAICAVVIHLLVIFFLIITFAAQHTDFQHTEK